MLLRATMTTLARALINWWRQIRALGQHKSVPIQTLAVRILFASNLNSLNVVFDQLLTGINSSILAVRLKRRHLKVLYKKEMDLKLSPLMIVIDRSEMNM